MWSVIARQQMRKTLWREGWVADQLKDGTVHQVILVCRSHYFPDCHVSFPISLLAFRQVRGEFTHTPWVCRENTMLPALAIHVIPLSFVRPGNVPHPAPHS